jgi:hypothetical protein
MVAATSIYTLSLIKGTPDEQVTHSLLPNFASFKSPDYIFKPISKNDLGNYVIQGLLYTTEKIINFQIKVTVSNKAPTFVNEKIQD